MNLVESAHKYSVSDSRYRKFEEELKQIYLGELGQDRGDKVPFEILLAALKDSGGSDLDYATLLMKAVLEEWVQSNDKRDPRRREIWLSEGAVGYDRSATIDEVKGAVRESLGEHMWKPVEESMKIPHLSPWA